jgi:hypothetical protein
MINCFRVPTIFVVVVAMVSSNMGTLFEVIYKTSQEKRERFLATVSEDWRRRPCDAHTVAVFTHASGMI